MEATKPSQDKTIKPKTTKKTHSKIKPLTTYEIVRNDLVGINN